MTAQYAPLFPHEQKKGRVRRRAREHFTFVFAQRSFIGMRYEAAWRTRAASLPFRRRQPQFRFSDAGVLPASRCLPLPDTGMRFLFDPDAAECPNDPRRRSGAAGAVSADEATKG